MTALQSFPHAVGHHCSSTSIRNILAYDGQHISEAMAFGLGSGMGMSYLVDPERSPTYRMNGRAYDLEGKFYRNIGQPIAWAREWLPEKMVAGLAEQRPILAQSNISKLPYYDDADFPTHGIVLTEIDLEGDTVKVSDIASDELQTITIHNLHEALAMTTPPLMPDPYHWIVAPATPDVVNAENIRRAIRTMTDEMLNPPNENLGLVALRRFAEELPSWDEAEDWVWAARFAYQAMEKRGTGGGSFRFLYANFLDEATAYIPILGDADAAHAMQDIGRQWVALAQTLKQVFVSQDTSGFIEAGCLATEIFEQEQALVEVLAQVV